MYLPLSIVPVKTVLSSFFSHCGGRRILNLSASWLQIKIGCIMDLLFCFCSVVLGYSLLASAITVYLRISKNRLSSRLLYHPGYGYGKSAEKVQFI